MQPRARLRLEVDLNERKSGIPTKLEALGFDVELRVLPAGDYAIGSEILVERKATLDLHAAILKGRFWTQIGKLRRASRYPFLLVEGADLDCGPIAPKAIRGACIATIEQGIRLIRTSGRDDSVLWLERLAVRTLKRQRRDRPRYAQAQQPPPKQAAEAILAAVPGISTKRARALLTEFSSVTGVMSAGPSAWLRIPGIGPSAAQALQETFCNRL